MSQTVDEAKLRKVVNEMLRQRCTSRDEHQYHIDQMQNFLKNDIFLAIIFSDDDIKERTSRWVNKCVKKFNPYARYGIEHWRNPHAKFFYTKKQKEPRKPKEIIARRANGSIVSITEPYYKNLNKNDIEDMYLLIVNDKVDDYIESGLLWSLSVFIRSTMIWERVHDFQLGVESYQQKVNLIAPTITFLGIEKHKTFSIVFELSVLEGLKSYNNNVNHGYVTPSLSKEDAEYLELFEEEINEWSKHRDRMRRYEIFKALDEGFSSKNYVRKFLRALHPKWREKVRVKSIFLKDKKESSDDETLTFESDDEEYAMAGRNFKKFFRRKGKFVRQPREEKKSFQQRDEKKGKSNRKCFRCGDPNHLIGDSTKPPRNKDQKAFIGGSCSDSENKAEDKTNNETCLMVQLSNEVTLDSSHYSDNASSFDDDSMQIKYDNLCEISLKIINKNKILKTKRDLLKLNEKIKKLKRNKEIDIMCESCQELKLENTKLKETQVKFVKFDKSANSLREMLGIQKSPSCKIGLGFDRSKASTSRIKPISFVGSSVENATDGSTIKVHGSTISGSVDPSSS
ncbi:hypothetical protein Tco_0646157 [Tanacetum coccineum]